MQKIYITRIIGIFLSVLILLFSYFLFSTFTFPLIHVQNFIDGLIDLQTQYSIFSLKLKYPLQVFNLFLQEELVKGFEGKDTVFFISKFLRSIPIDFMDILSQSLKLGI